MPPNHAEQVRVVHKLAALRSGGTVGPALLDALDEADLEVMLRGFPDDLSEPLTLFAMLTFKTDASGSIPKEKLPGWIKLCASWLCLEWLKRDGAVSDYVFGDTGINWTTNPARVTSEFLDGLARRHEVIHHFAAGIFRRAAPTAMPGGPTLN